MRRALVSSAAQSSSARQPVSQSELGAPFRLLVPPSLWEKRRSSCQHFTADTPLTITHPRDQIKLRLCAFSPPLICSSPRGNLSRDDHDAKQRGSRGWPLHAHPPEQEDPQAGGAGGPPEPAGGRVPADHHLPFLLPRGSGGECALFRRLDRVHIGPVEVKQN